MDPISLAASIAGVLSLSETVFRYVFKFIKSVNSAENEAKELARELRDLAGLFKSLSLLADELDDDDTAAVTNTTRDSYFQTNHLESCYHFLSKIKAKLEQSQKDLDSPRKLDAFQRRLKWPFAADEIKDFKSELSRHKSTITLAVTAESMASLGQVLSRQEDQKRHTAQIQANVQKVLEITTRIEVNKTRLRVLDFFMKFNPQSILDMSIKLRYPFTSLWLTEEAEFKTWLHQPHSRLWLNGDAGVGKTVLAGSIIEKTLSFSAVGCVTAYFFCDGSNGSLASATDVLGAIASQLARQSDDAFDILEEYFDRLVPQNSLSRQATLEGLAAVISEMTKVFERVYVVVDGIDEHGDDAGDIAQCLADVYDSSDTCSLAIFSRDEISIREHLEGHFCEIKAFADKEDVQLCVTAALEQRIQSKKLRIRNPHLKDEIVEALVHGAGGMFRWVSCQLDYLCGLPTDRDKWSALRGLPPTLTETYDRILERVNRHNSRSQEMVEKSLALISLVSPRIRINELCEAISVHDGIDISDPESIVEESEISRRCSSLIRKTEDGLYFEFPHFSHVSEKKTATLLTRASIQFLLLPEFGRENPRGVEEAYDVVKKSHTRPFYSYAARFWTTQDKGWWEDEVARGLDITLFNPEKGPNFKTWAIELCRHFVTPATLKDENMWQKRPTAIMWGEDLRLAIELCAQTILRADFTPLHLAATLGIPFLCEHLLRSGCEINLKSPIGTPLHCALAGPCLFVDGNILDDTVIDHMQMRSDGLMGDFDA
ncbi:hypothetical protein QBC35DRAFT_542264 [Podospora australis]|uniref:NACHT domain-containing protein n=1 Tax=Podospora australis TaxID=1536484 RepID=A0AAN7ACP9_9PEZI|nr:hypothetical protein QBC35DRAFT_542264 [Podospora australis]